MIAASVSRLLPSWLRKAPKRGLGHKRDHKDSRDVQFAAPRLGSSLRPREQPMWQSVAHILDQGATNSCTGQCVAPAVEMVEARAGLPYDAVSTMDAYRGARSFHYAQQQDLGSYLRYVLKFGQLFGFGPDRLWPFDARHINVAPPVLVRSESHPRRGGKYERIFETGEQRVEVVLDALAGGHPVVFGTAVTEAFMSHRGSGTVQRPSSSARIAGRHAMCLGGYETGGDRILAVNSWGRNWGDEGFCWMDPEYIAWSETADLWIFHGWQRLLDHLAQQEDEVTDA